MIHLKDIHFRYHKDKPLFQNLDLDMEAGHIYGFLGKNGAGKTTLMKIISGLLFPHVGDCEVMGFRPRERRVGFLSDLYFIPEEFATPDGSILAFSEMHAAFYPNFDRKRFNGYLDDFNLDVHLKFKNLSYGQKKKAILSFGLATNCRLLIMDEPTNGLDIPSKGQFRKILAGAITDERCFIISTHQVRDMTNLIDPIIILDERRIIFQESLEHIGRHLYFGMGQGMEPPLDCLYSERAPGGYRFVSANPQGEDTDVDLELLFNTVSNQQGPIIKLFKKEMENAQ